MEIKVLLDGLVIGVATLIIVSGLAYLFIKIIDSFINLFRRK